MEGGNVPNWETWEHKEEMKDRVTGRGRKTEDVRVDEREGGRRVTKPTRGSFDISTRIPTRNALSFRPRRHLSTRAFLVSLVFQRSRKH